MLTNIYIKNLAVIKEMSLDLCGGLNVFTGETGAGKSVVIDAVNVVLGARASKELVRHGEKNALILASFSGVSAEGAIGAKLEQEGIEVEDGVLIFERRISADGGSVSRLNGKPTTTAVIKEIGQLLLNLHGQHDTLTLLNPLTHLALVDKQAGNKGLLAEYRAVFREVALIKKEINRILSLNRDKERRIDLLTYQIEEIRAADINPLEDQTLQSEITLMVQSKKIEELLSNSTMIFSGDDDNGGVIDGVRAICSNTKQAKDLYPQIDDIYNRMDEICYDLDDINLQLQKLLGQLDFSEQELIDKQERLELVKELISKYGGSINAVYDFLASATKELDQINTYEESLVNLEQQGKDMYAKLVQIAKEITASRTLAAKQLEDKMCSELSFLEMPNAYIEVKFTPCKLNQNGGETAEIYIVTNKGTTPKPLAKIASGGELSRIMLAITKIMNESYDDNDPSEIKTMIFDEIDSGVSGKTATRIGEKLKEVSNHKQVLCVTHSAQIAAIASNHYLISKKTQGEETITSIVRLDTESRKAELARIIGTGIITDTVLKTAEEMMKQ